MNEPAEPIEPPPGPTEPPSAAPPSRLRAAWAWWRPLVYLLVAMLALRSSVLDWNDVPSGSMKPTILEGERVVVNRLAYDLKVPFTRWRLAQWGQPERGDIVVFHSPENGRRLIKRVVGVPGDVIAMRDNRLSINGQAARYEPAQETWPLAPEELADAQLVWETLGERRHAVRLENRPSGLANFGPVRVPPDQFCMMGDNRDESKDSRVIGFVPRELVLGRAWAVAFSFERFPLEPRWNRFFRGLP